MKKILLFCLFAIGMISMHGQQMWNDCAEPTLDLNYIKPQKARYLQADFNQIKAQLSDVPHEDDLSVVESDFVLMLPHPDGSLQAFKLVEAPIMEDGLSEKYPELRSFLGQGIDDPTARLRCNITHKGFHAMVLNNEGTWFIDPYSMINSDYYLAYTRSSFYATNTKSFVEGAIEPSTEFNINKDQLDEQLEIDRKGKKGKKVLNMGFNMAKTPSGTQLRTYRLALAGTGEYTAFHGGTVVDGLAAMATSMTRVNGVYESEFAIRMVIVANNNLIVYTNGATDPYTNGNGGTMLNENQNNCDNVIGSANYDIGHVYSTGGGGIAQLNSPCGSGKARGVTGQGAPVGDPFDIDYVCHEMGHQFGGNHTQNNSCNRSTGAAFEPGSASTIMGYAGICPPNLQSNSDDYFHNHSYNEIINFSQNGNGNTCAVLTPTGNTPPTVDAGPSGYVIPISTPFELTATGNDADGDILTYTWEQYDLGPATTDINNPTGNQPIFRSWKGTVDPTRVFPRITDLVNNTTAVGEVLPDYARNMNFRCTVRDNRAGGGGVNDDQMSMSVSDQAGPFLVSSPNSAVTFPGNSIQNISWDVAGTNAAPVNCSNVDIYLSTDGGLTYPTLLLAGTPNDGSQAVFIPAGETTTARIKVKASNNVFFDISNTNFTIGAAVGANDNDAAVLGIASPTGDYCGDDFDLVFTIANQGALNLTSLNIQYILDGAPGVNIPWSGNLGSGQTEEITVAGLSAPTGPHTMQIVLSLPNGVSDDNATNNTSSSTFSTVSNASNLTFSFLTDCWGEESSWILADDQGTTIQSVSSGTLADQTLFTYDFCLADGCYDVTIGDTYGDGLNGTAFNCAIDGNYSLVDGQGTVLFQMGVADFGNEVIESFCVSSAGPGCTDVTACNYDDTATSDDGSCEFTSCAGCTNATACNFDATATIDDGSCILPDGCTDAGACNFDPTASCDDGSCEFTSCAGCTNATACNFDATATIDDGSCVLPDGCTDAGACNFDPTASCDDGSCEFTSCAGCTNATACNFDATATIDDGSCILPDGCTDAGACNFDPTASCDDGSCEFTSCAGCTNPLACNFDPTASVDDGTCNLPDGCTDDTACNYDPTATCDDGTCEFDSCNACFADFNNDNNVNATDLLIMIGEYGCDVACGTDLNNDDVVNGADLLLLLGVFGTQCN
jgi:hypothetical protein